MLEGDNLNRIGPIPSASQGINFASSTSPLFRKWRNIMRQVVWGTNGYNVIASTLSQTITHGIIVVCVHGPFVPEHLNLANQELNINLKCDM